MCDDTAIVTDYCRGCHVEAAFEALSECADCGAGFHPECLSSAIDAHLLTCKTEKLLRVGVSASECIDSDDRDSIMECMTTGVPVFELASALIAISAPKSASRSDAINDVVRAVWKNDANFLGSPTTREPDLYLRIALGGGAENEPGAIPAYISHFDDKILAEWLPDREHLRQLLGLGQGDAAEEVLDAVFERAYRGPAIRSQQDQSRVIKRRNALDDPYPAAIRDIGQTARSAADQKLPVDVTNAADLRVVSDGLKTTPISRIPATTKPPGVFYAVKAAAGDWGKLPQMVLDAKDASKATQAQKINAVAEINVGGMRNMTVFWTGVTSQGQYPNVGKAGSMRKRPTGAEAPIASFFYGILDQRVYLLGGRFFQTVPAQFQYASETEQQSSNRRIQENNLLREAGGLSPMEWKNRLAENALVRAVDEKKSMRMLATAHYFMYLDNIRRLAQAGVQDASNFYLAHAMSQEPSWFRQLLAVPESPLWYPPERYRVDATVINFTKDAEGLFMFPARIVAPFVMRDLRHFTLETKSEVRHVYLRKSIQSLALWGPSVNLVSFSKPGAPRQSSSSELVEIRATGIQIGALDRLANLIVERGGQMTTVRLDRCVHRGTAEEVTLGELMAYLGGKENLLDNLAVLTTTPPTWNQIREALRVVRLALTISTRPVEDQPVDIEGLDKLRMEQISDLQRVTESVPVKKSKKKKKTTAKKASKASDATPVVDVDAVPEFLDPSDQNARKYTLQIYSVVGEALLPLHSSDIWAVRAQDEVFSVIARYLGRTEVQIQPSAIVTQGAQSLISPEVESKLERDARQTVAEFQTLPASVRILAMTAPSAVINAEVGTATENLVFRLVSFEDETILAETKEASLASIASEYDPVAQADVLLGPFPASVILTPPLQQTGNAASASCNIRLILQQIGGLSTVALLGVHIEESVREDPPGVEYGFELARDLYEPRDDPGIFGPRDTIPKWMEDHRGGGLMMGDADLATMHNYWAQTAKDLITMKVLPFLGDQVSIEDVLQDGRIAAVPTSTAGARGPTVGYEISTVQYGVSERWGDIVAAYNLGFTPTVPSRPPLFADEFGEYEEEEEARVRPMSFPILDPLITPIGGIAIAEEYILNAGSGTSLARTRGESGFSDRSDDVLQQYQEYYASVSIDDRDAPIELPLCYVVQLARGLDQRAYGVESIRLVAREQHLAHVVAARMFDLIARQGYEGSVLYTVARGSITNASARGPDESELYDTISNTLRNIGRIDAMPEETPEQLSKKTAREIEFRASDINLKAMALVYFIGVCMESLLGTPGIMVDNSRVRNFCERVFKDAFVPNLTWITRQIPNILLGEDRKRKRAKETVREQREAEIREMERNEDEVIAASSVFSSSQQATPEDNVSFF